MVSPKPMPIIFNIQYIKGNSVDNGASPLGMLNVIR